MPIDTLKVVRVKFAQGDTNCLAEVMGHSPEPVYHLVNPYGRQFAWNMSMVSDDVTPEEAAEYWRERAHAAESKLKEQAA